MPDDLNTMQDLSVSLIVTPEIRSQLDATSAALAEVRGYQIDSAEVAQMVADEMNAIKRKTTQLETLKTTFVKPARDIIAAAAGLFDSRIKNLRDAEGYCKDLLARWDEQERNRIRLENQKREAEERSIRQEAEAKAAAERARAAEQAEQQRREQAEQERKAQEAREAGDKRAAAQAEAKAAEAATKAEQAIETGAAKAQQAELVAAVSIATPAPAPIAQAVAGVQFKDNWVPKLKDKVDEETAKRLIVLQAADDFQGRGDTQLLACLQIDMTTVRRLAKGLKGQMRVPGFEAVNERLVAGRNK